MIVIATNVDRDEGTIVVFAGYEVETELPVLFAADHRPAQDIVEALEAEGPVRCSIETWQVIG